MRIFRKSLSLFVLLLPSNLFAQWVELYEMDPYGDGGDTGFWGYVFGFILLSFGLIRVWIYVGEKLSEASTEFKNKELPTFRRQKLKSREVIGQLKRATKYQNQKGFETSIKVLSQYLIELRFEMFETEKGKQFLPNASALIDAYNNENIANLTELVYLVVITEENSAYLPLDTNSRKLKEFIQGELKKANLNL